MKCRQHCICKNHFVSFVGRLFQNQMGRVTHPYHVKKFENKFSCRIIQKNIMREMQIILKLLDQMLEIIQPYIWINLEDFTQGFRFACLQNSIISRTKPNDYRCYCDSANGYVNKFCIIRSEEKAHTYVKTSLYPKKGTSLDIISSKMYIVVFLYYWPLNTTTRWVVIYLV